MFDALDQETLDGLFGDEVHATAIPGLDPRRRAEVLADADALLVWNWRGELQPEEARQSSVRLVQLMSAGADHLPFDQLPPDALVASNVGAYAAPMAEHVLAMILTILKRLRTNHDKLAQGVWDHSTPTRTLSGAQCAIVGYGGIGRAVATHLRGFGGRIHAINTSGTTTDPVDFVGTLDDLDNVLHVADVIVLSLPLTRRTRGLIDRSRLQNMKPSAVLVNVARGSIVDEDALFEHLRTHPDFTAAIDTWWNEPDEGKPFRTNRPFFDLPNLLGSPHNSGIVAGMTRTAARAAAANITRFARGEPLTGIVRPEEYVDS